MSGAPSACRPKAPGAAAFSLPDHVAGRGCTNEPTKTKSVRDIRILVTGGGTGGHVTPALATIRAIQQAAEGQDWRPVFLYVGSLHGVEREMAEDAGIPFHGVQTGKMRRAARWWQQVSAKNVADAFRVPIGVGQAMRALVRFRPDVVLATGGYVAVPPVIAASTLRIPVLIHEQTVQVGLANRIAARFATTVALSFEGSISALPASERKKAIVTGNPVREIIFGGDRTRAMHDLGFDNADGALPTVYVTGGAQGSHVINEAVREALPELVAIVRIVHQCGQQPPSMAQDYDLLTAAREALPDELKRRYHVTRFVREEIGDVFALADIVVGRSGAGTVTEVCAVGKPAIYVPLVPTGGDEQNKNARRAADAGAAVIIPSAELTGTRLLDELRSLVSSAEALQSMGSAATRLAKPQAARDLAAATLKLAGVASDDV